MKVVTDERCLAYQWAGHPERPQRVSRTVERLRAQDELPIQWVEPLPVADDIMLRAHTKDHLQTLRSGNEHFDGDTPRYADLMGHAVRSVGGALQALAIARSGEIAFSLLRPPGHHAMQNRAMGFCYLNSITLAVLEAVASGAKKVAVYDFDVHHGNGTEAILLNHPHAVFFSIHQHPCYPGTGSTNVGQNCCNYPVAPRTPRADYRQVLERALGDLAKARPDLVAVSAGFDAYARDPLAQETLEAEDFYWLGQSFRKLGLPTFSILEGGYSNALPDLILAYLKGLDGK